jgi:hypothetical protein
VEEISTEEDEVHLERCIAVSITRSDSLLIKSTHFTLFGELKNLSKAVDRVLTSHWIFLHVADAENDFQYRNADREQQIRLTGCQSLA